MFKRFFTTLKGGDELDRAFAQFTEMLDHAEWMFARANEMLTGSTADSESRDALYERDRAINDLLRSIRGIVVRHLTFNPGLDVPASLALINVAKDAERIGDYCKNVFEVGRHYEKPPAHPEYQGLMDEACRSMEALFCDVKQAWHESDSTKARNAMERAYEIRQQCEIVIDKLLRGRGTLETHEAVAYSLLARHYKRVAAHLANICTAVMGNIEELDFRR